MTDLQRQALRQNELRVRGIPTGGVNLVHASVAASTLLKYKTAVRLFRKWVWDTGRSWSPIMPPEVWDQLLLDYGNHLFTAGRPRYLLTNAVFGAELLYPSLKRRLPLARRAITGFTKLEASVRAPPLAEELLPSLAAMARVHHSMDHAVSVLVAFNAYLRSSDLVGLRVRDVNFVGAHAVLHIEQSKTGRHQAASLEDPDVVLLLKALVARRRAAVGLNGRLFPYTSTGEYQRNFKTWVEAMHLGHLGLVPHSLRHGGATRDFLRGMEVARIQIKGRWRDPKSAAHYIQSCPALLQKQSVPSALLEKGRRLLTRLLVLFRSGLSPY